MSMISELVERLRRYARFSKVNNPSWSGAMTEAADTIEALSEKCKTIDAEPVRHGKWSMRRDSKRLETIATCSCCGYEHDYFVAYNVIIDKMPYCPNCGAKMDGESEVQE